MNERINLQDLSALLAEKMAITKKEAEIFLREYFEVLNEELIKSGLVKIKDLGTFKLISVENRESINVTTGERILIPAHYKVAFTSDKKLAEKVNEPFAFFETTEIEGESRPDEIENDSEDSELNTDDSDLSTDEEGDIAYKAESESLAEKEPIFEEEQPKDDPAEENEEVIPEETPKNKREVKNYCFNCRDYEAHHVYRKKYFKIRRKLHTLRAIIFILSVLLAIAVGYIIYSKLYGTSIFNKLSLPKTMALAPIQKNDSTASPVLTDSMASKKIPVEQNATEKIASPATSEKSKQMTIETGQRLASIAEKEYGNKVFWVYIYLENRAIISNPNVLPVGATISIPPADKYSINSNDPASIQKAKDVARKYP